MNKKTVSMIAMMVSVLMVFFGLLVLAGAMGGDTDAGSGYSVSFTSTLYDNGYAEFGADFYTYVSNNAAAAADAAESAAKAAYNVASNLDEIATLLKSACGIFLMGFGLLSLCHFGMIWIDEKKNEPEAAPAVECAPVEEAPAEEAPAEEVPLEEEAPAEEAENE